ncbi:PadR family transcriptional regulator [Stakelama saccharophila]|uniref:PadR family transcriptional regulator n=1 Tax=Stakelama saccharophila TaxID=3075605 RepID=A0ABZ0B5M7_9SPHN|nr:PadR family transcriptional regulator [Stakelama sp. W311]WNO52679.1 PadR family transcriptional regulator [Stakelama sp. W311]
MGHDAWMGGRGRHAHHGHGSHGSHRGPGWGRRAKRMFDGGELRLVLLKLIAEEPRHGYDLIREIEERTGGAYAPSPGVVYPTITMLGDMDLIAEQDSEGAKKVYAATDAGRTHLEENAQEVERLFARLDEVGSMRERTSGGPVRRAMGNLRSVLQDRLTREDVSDDTLHDVAGIIDDAARRIERL